jgi:hypothetical protein
VSREIAQRTETLKAMVLRGALAANGVTRIAWPDGVEDDLDGRWDTLPLRVRMKWESLVRVVEPSIAGFRES